jgi:hypothetical protein
MSAKITVTYKRKRGASKARADDGVVPEPPPVSGGEVAGGEASKHEVGADNSLFKMENPGLSLSLIVEFSILNVHFYCIRLSALGLPLLVSPPFLRWQ